MELSRRDMLKLGLFGSAALMLPAERIARAKLALGNRIPASQLPKPFTLPFAKPPVLTPDYATADTAYYTLTQQQVEIPVLGPGKPSTTIWGYNGYTPGPTIVNQQGQQAVVRQINALPKRHPDKSLDYNVWTSTHLHGSCSLPQYDGYASDITEPGQYKDYRYPNMQDARTLWYHDHGVHITAPNAYMGLAAQYILHDANELSLPIPHGPYDVPFVLKDAMFQENGDLIYEDNNQSGVYGDVILVNGVPWPLMKVEPRKYRFRILNASISRSYDLALSTGEPMTVIATDGGLMPHPQPVGNFRIGMAERYEVVIDFSKYRPGQQVVMKNLGPKNNIDYDTTNVVCAFEVGSAVSSTANNEIPQDLNPNMKVMGLTEADADRTRKVEFKREGGHWTINGMTWEDVVNSDYDLCIANPGYEDVEIWELANPHGGWFHPVHIHLVDFKILDRTNTLTGAVSPPMPHELGPKDVAYVGEDEMVRVIMRFEHQRGKYMMHCHNLVHEDHDMMAQFEVGEGGDDPIHADPARDLPAGPLFVVHDDHDDHGDDDHHGDDHGSGSSGGSSSSGGSAPATGAPAPAGVPAAAAPAAAAAVGAPAKQKHRKKKRRTVKKVKKVVKAKKRKVAKSKAPKHKSTRTTRRARRS
jgi:spore coat protein A, manganese oxidase